MLHKRIDTLENAASIDKLTQLFSREEMEARIRSLDSTTMSILLLKAGGLGAAEAQFGADVSEQLAGAFAKRLRHIMPPTAVIGRWSEEVFMAMLQAEKLEASTLAKRISENLAGSYASESGQDSASGDPFADVSSGSKGGQRGTVAAMGGGVFKCGLRTAFNPPSPRNVKDLIGSAPSAVLFPKGGRNRERIISPLICFF
jgi:GGDEF domain-containing protein